MKKIITLFVICILCMSLIFSAAADPKKPNALSKKLSIQGGYDEVASLSVTPIASQAEAYKIGMPFSIDDSSVRYNKTEYKGRLIANWSMLTNFNFVLEVTGEALHHYEVSNVGGPTYQKGLGYILEFVYNISFYNGTEIQYIPRTFSVAIPNTAKTTTVTWNKVLGDNKASRGTLVGSADGEIYFKFDQSTTTKWIENSSNFASLKNGNYLANVTLNIKAIE